MEKGSLSPKLQPGKEGGGWGVLHTLAFLSAALRSTASASGLLSPPRSQRAETKRCGCTGQHSGAQGRKQIRREVHNQSGMGSSPGGFLDPIENGESRGERKGALPRGEEVLSLGILGLTHQLGNQKDLHRTGTPKIWLNNQLGEWDCACRCRGGGGNRS